MAIQFARCEYISRSTGGNACRKAAYNERTAITCERTGETFSFAHKEDGAHHEILLPEGASTKFMDSAVLWNEAERCERRKDSQVATALRDSGFEGTKTCHGFLFALKNERDSLDAKTLVVVDEAGMMGSVLSVELFNAVKKSGAKLVLVGDDRQLSSVDRPGAFGLLAERHGSIELREVRRQTVEWQKAVSEDLSQGNIKSAVDLLQSHGAITWQDTKEDSLSTLLKDWSHHQGTGTHQILAQRNVDVDALNEGAREILRSQGKLGELEVICATQRGKKAFAVGDRIQLTKTDKDQGLENGRFGTITAIDSNTKILSIQLDNKETREVNPFTYNGLRHGYAATVYKAQGATLDHVYVLHGNTTNQSTNYVALTRQTKSLSLYVSKNETATQKDLIWQMGRATGKGTSLHFDTQRNIDRRQEDKPFLAHLKHGVEDLLTTVKDRFHRNEEFYRFEKSVHKHEEVTLHTLNASHHKVELEKQQREDMRRAAELTHERERVHEEFQKSNDGPSL